MGSRAKSGSLGDFLEYATDLAYLCSNICIYSSTMAEEIGQLGKQLLRRWTEVLGASDQSVGENMHMVTIGGKTRILVGFCTLLPELTCQFRDNKW